MITIHQTAELPYSPHEMYELVNDVAAYPQFIPFCTVGASTPINESETSGTLTFACLGIVQSFVTHNVLRPPYEVKLTLIEGPFKYLEGAWKFTPLSGNSTRAAFVLKFEFEFSNAWVDYFLQPIFNTLSYNAMQVFIQRAHACYQAQDRREVTQPA
jgi:ribosome-associated toxin RatA of RatAB toxin-antitoxin module